MSDRITMLNSVIRGWINYFAIGAMKSKLVRIDEHLRTMLRKVIWKQWKTPQKRAWGLRKLGICNDLAKLTSYSGDRYEWVVRRTCVARAISKDYAEQRDTRMDKLLCHWCHEKQAGKDRRASAHDVT